MKSKKLSYKAFVDGYIVESLVDYNVVKNAY